MLETTQAIVNGKTHTLVTEHYEENGEMFYEHVSLDGVSIELWNQDEADDIIFGGEWVIQNLYSH